MARTQILGMMTLLFILGGSAFPLRADENDPNAQAQLFLAKAEGKVYVVHQKKQHAANPPEPLVESDKIKTSSDSKGYLEFQNGGVVEVGPNSEVTVSQLEITSDDFKAKFLLAWGKFKAKVQKLTSAKSSFEVQAGGVVAGVRGTVFGVDYDKTKKQVDAQTFEGSIFTRAGGKEQVIDKGYSAVVQKTGLSVKSPLTGQQMNSFHDFEDISGQLEQKKQEMLQEMHGKLMEKLPSGVLPQKQEDDLKNTIGQKLPF